MCLYGLALRGRMGKLERGGVQHLARYGHEARIARTLEAKHAVADYRMAEGGKVAANLVGATRLDADTQKGGVLAHGLARYVRDCWQTVQRRIHRHVGMREASNNDCPVFLLDEMCLEHLYGGGVRLGGTGEKQATGRVAVKPMDGLDGRIVQLLAQDRLHATRIVGGKESRRLVHNKEVTEFRQHAHMRTCLGCDGAFWTGGLAAYGREGGVRKLHNVARLQRMVGNPNAPAVHPCATPIDHGLGRAAGYAQPSRKEVLQRLACVRFTDNTAFEIGAIAHSHTRMIDPTTPTIFLP